MKCILNCLLLPIPRGITYRRLHSITFPVLPLLSTTESKDDKDSIEERRGTRLTFKATAKKATFQGKS
jgi:hypothetical protein